jgi:predicted nucleic acid-binding protein
MNGEAVISTQVLQEFYVVATSKLHLDPIVSKSIMHTFENMEVVTIGKDLINEAIDAGLQYRLSFWDALILVAAESAKCEVLYSEDRNDGQIMRNVRAVNPLLEWRKRRQNKSQEQMPGQCLKRSNLIG